MACIRAAYLVSLLLVAMVRADILTTTTELPATDNTTSEEELTAPRTPRGRSHDKQHQGILDAAVLTGTAVGAVALAHGV
mmetsp:Transcript_38130/g.118957  ORF Transcript_38130/g.118957 Transcript_38130/m.118957 type:complete len:80 (+) Transcript_38130:67-306(+)